MTQEVKRSYLEINSLKDLKEVQKPSSDYSLKLLDPVNFQLNKFFYKNVGKKHKWIDRLSWNDLNWTKYISNPKLFTYLLQDGNEIVGYFELVYETKTKVAEIAYFGILEEYFGQKLGGYLLSEAIKKSFSMGINRVWLHTCSLDHDNALKNYLSRGMKIFKEESLKL